MADTVNAAPIPPATGDSKPTAIFLRIQELYREEGIILAQTPTNDPITAEQEVLLEQWYIAHNKPCILLVKDLAKLHREAGIPVANLYCWLDKRRDKDYYGESFNAGTQGQIGEGVEGEEMQATTAAPPTEPKNQTPSTATQTPLPQSQKPAESTHRGTEEEEIVQQNPAEGTNTTRVEHNENIHTPSAADLGIPSIAPYHWPEYVDREKLATHHARWCGYVSGVWKLCYCPSKLLTPYDYNWLLERPEYYKMTL